jgi:EAL domain-containing protein (putative c-di-GMP-specific phosphodiesterase class I)
LCEAINWAAKEYSRVHHEKRILNESYDRQIREAELTQNLVALRAAIVADEFEMYYQPLVNAEGRFSSFEALMRWNSPSRGRIGPSEFVPLAEASGLIAELGHLALNKVCVQAAQWLRVGLPFGRLAVNISPLQLEEATFPDTLDATMKQEGVDGNCLCAEITESACLGCETVVAQRLKQLAQRNILIALDDFGVGHSSLGRLQEINCDVVKIDRAFVMRLEEGSAGYHVVAAIISMAHSLGISVVAEGVETAEQCRLLREAGIDKMQGYYFSMPLKVSEAEAYLRLSRSP